MTEVPEHLLERSRARRAALGLGGDDAPAAAAETSDSSAVPATTAAAAPAAVAAAAPAAIEVVAAPPPPYVQAGLDRRKPPWWAASVLALLPIWAVVYAGTLSPASTGEPTQIELGGEIFAERCASCHGATGGGGTGPALADGAVLETWPERADHLRWVWGGSVGWPGTTYGAQDKAKKSGMPNFGEALTPDELLAVIRYEREVLSGEEILEEDGFAIDAEGRLVVITDEGEVDAVDYYFGEGAEAGGTYVTEGDEVYIEGAEYSAPAP